MNKLGQLSAAIFLAISVTYAITVTIGMASYGFDRPIGGITLVVMEILTLLSALLIVAMMAAIHSSDGDKWKTNTLIALVFAASALRGSKRIHQLTRVTTGACGVMCLVGVVGPATGEIRLQFVAVAGYGLVFPALCLMLTLAWNATDET